MRALTLLFTVSLFLSSYSVSAQEWAPEGATWYYSYTFGMRGPSAYLKVEADKTDKLVNGIQCRVLLRSPTGKPFTDTMYIYSDSGRVYIYNDAIKGFHKVYDFDADTFTSWIIALSWYDSEIDTFQVKPVYKGHITHNGKTIRRDSVSFKRISKSHRYDMAAAKLEAIEFMGYTGTDLIPWRAATDDGDWTGPLRCYTDSFIGHYETGASPSCETGINDESNRSSFKLFPNPATGSVELEFEKWPASPLLVSIVDVTGKQYLRAPLNIFQHSLSLDGLKPGMYMVRISSAEGAHTEKLLVR